MISYNIPAYKYHGMLVFFAAYKNHIGFYPTASGIANFKNELSKYKTSRGAVQFPIDEPLPFDLISKIVRARVKENEDRAEIKTAAKNKNEKFITATHIRRIVFQNLICLYFDNHCF